MKKLKICAVALVVLLFTAGFSRPDPDFFAPSFTAPRPDGVDLWSLFGGYGYVHVRGGEFFADFAGVPDFRHFARLGPNRIVESPTITRSRSYQNHAGVTYTFRSRAIDYIYFVADYYDQVNTALQQYKAMLTQILTMYDNMGQIGGVFMDYYDEIVRELLLDPNFVLDHSGVFALSTDETFRLLLIGRSITVYPRTGHLVPSIQFRFYSRSRTPYDPLDLMSVTGTLVNDPFNVGSGPHWAFSTPVAARGLGHVSDDVGPFFATPVAVIGGLAAHGEHILVTATPGTPVPDIIGSNRAVGFVTPEPNSVGRHYISLIPPIYYFTPGALGHTYAIPSENVTYLFGRP